VKPSTKAFFQEGRRTQNYNGFDFFHGYLYGRWPYLYIGIGIGEHPAARALGALARIFQPGLRLLSSLAPRSKSTRFADTYHGKVISLPAATQLVQINEAVRLTNLEKIIPYDRARDLILENPEHIVALDCPCRSARENPCLPLDVCLIVGEPFASFISEHHPDHTRWISQKEAEEILRAEHARGHVHHAFFKDAMLNRFYAICNCCSCCCGAMQAQRNGTPMLASSGYLAQIDESLCIGCEECASACPFNALALQDFTMEVDTGLCMGCGVCVDICEQGAILLERAPEKGEPLEIFRLLDQVAV
jgi:ferredoxin